MICWIIRQKMVMSLSKIPRDVRKLFKQKRPVTKALRSSKSALRFSNLRKKLMKVEIELTINIMKDLRK